MARNDADDEESPLSMEDTCDADDPLVTLHLPLIDLPNAHGRDVAGRLGIPFAAPCFGRDTCRDTE